MMLLASPAGIYRIRNRVTGEAYIGSTFNLRQRIKAHVSNLRSGRHENKGLQVAWDALGLSAFAFSILEVTDEDNDVLLEAEERWMATLRPLTVGFYNRREAHIGRRYGTRDGRLCQCRRCLERRSTARPDAPKEGT